MVNFESNKFERVGKEVLDTPNNALSAAVNFGGDYSLYVDWCAQWMAENLQGEVVAITPISKDAWVDLLDQIKIAL